MTRVPELRGRRLKLRELRPSDHEPFTRIHTHRLLTRYLGYIQVQRGDFNGRMLTVRRDDLRAIACLLDVNPDVARGKLDELGLRLTQA